MVVICNSLTKSLRSGQPAGPTWSFPIFSGARGEEGEGTGGTPRGAQTPIGDRRERGPEVGQIAATTRQEVPSRNPSCRPVGKINLSVGGSSPRLRERSRSAGNFRLSASGFSPTRSLLRAAWGISACRSGPRPRAIGLGPALRPNAFARFHPVSGEGPPRPYGFDEGACRRGPGVDATTATGPAAQGCPLRSGTSNVEGRRRADRAVSHPPA